MEPIIPLALSFLGVNQTELQNLQTKTEFYIGIVEEIHNSDECKNYIEPLYGIKDWLLKPAENLMINELDDAYDDFYESFNDTEIIQNSTAPMYFEEYEGECFIEWWHGMTYNNVSTITQNCQMINFMYCIQSFRDGKLNENNQSCPWLQSDLNFTVSNCVDILLNEKFLDAEGREISQEFSEEFCFIQGRMMTSDWIIFRGWIHNKWLDFFVLYGFVVLLISAFSQKRRKSILKEIENENPGFLNGYFAIPRVGNLVSCRRDRVLWVCVHVLCVEILMRVVLDEAKHMPMPYIEP